MNNSTLSSNPILEVIEDVAKSNSMPAAATKSTVGHSSSSFLDIFLQADLVIQIVMVILIIASLWSWSIIFEKSITLRALKKRMNNFERDFWAGVSFDRLFKNIKGKEDNPLAMVFTAAIDEVQTKKSSNGDTSSFSVHTGERLKQAMYVASNKAIEMIERNLTFLATVGSCATFIGLFGTVWGIMASFQSIAASKNTTLAVVAPGIAEALFATALGLIAAIPAMIFYNKFAAEVNKISNRVQDFAIELGNMIMRELEK